VDALNSAYSSADGVLFNKHQTVLIQYPGGKAGGYTIPNTVTSIGIDGFHSCTNLTSVTIPNSLTSIGDRAFAYCTSLASITIGNSVTSIGVSAFSSCTRLTSVTIPNSVTSIRAAAFSYCTGLSSITIPNSVTSIDERAFSSCTNLTNVMIPNSVTNIGASAFGECSSLTSVTIPNSVANIGVRAFGKCSSLTSVTIPNSVTSIGYIAFGECSSLTAITVDALNSAYSSADGVLFNKNQTILIQYPGGKAGSYTIPNSLTSIEFMGFADCTSLTSVTIPNSVTRIGRFAFSGCSNLTAITVDALNSAYSSADGVLFNKNQTMLILYPVGKARTCYTIPNSVTSIDWGAFFGCFSLTRVYFLGNAPRLVRDAFDDFNKATVFYVAGTTGWGSTYDGCPTAMWSPQGYPLVQSHDASFGVRTNRFGFTINCSSNSVIVVEACTNLVNPTWFPLQTNTLSGDSLYFSDPQWTNDPGRFYRLRSP